VTIPDATIINTLSIFHSHQQKLYELPMLRRITVLFPLAAALCIHPASSFGSKPSFPSLLSIPSPHPYYYEPSYESTSRLTINHGNRRVLFVRQSSTVSQDDGVSTADNGGDVSEEGSSGTNSVDGVGVLQRVTLRRYLNGVTKKETKLRDMESLSVSIQMACKTISNLVNGNSINQLPTSSTTTTTPQNEVEGGRDLGLVQYDMRMNSMKRLDQISTTVLRNALRFTGKLQTVKPAEDDSSTEVTANGKDDRPNEHQPGVLIASTLDSKYVAVFDPLDGSGNADAAICTGTIFGIFETDDDDDEGSPYEDSGIDNVVVGGGETHSHHHPSSYSHRSSQLSKAVLQPGKKLRAAGYCLYSSATILVFTLGEGTHGFTLDPHLNEFVLTHPNIRIPPRGNVYSCNEANSEGWSPDLKRYVKALKTGDNEIGERYALRYVGSMVGDIHRTLMYGGIFFYPADGMQSRGNLQLLYKSAPMGFVIEQAGGKSTNGKRGLLDVKPGRVHERSPCFIGSPENIEEMKKYVKHDE